MLYADFKQRVYDGRNSARGELERCLLRSKLRCLGVDEVGRGCLAGPVYACASLIDLEKILDSDSEDIKLIRDSKTLSAKQRQHSIEILKSYVIEKHIASADPREIEVLGILQASFLAMRRAIAQFANPVDVILVDGNQRIPGVELPQIAVIKGDHSCYSIAAASIFAKEARDHFMRDQDKLYPDYGFGDHVGYGTKAHLKAIETHGPTPMHRMNFAPLKKDPVQLSLGFIQT